MKDILRQNGQAKIAKVDEMRNQTETMQMDVAGTSSAPPPV